MIKRVELVTGQYSADVVILDDQYGGAGHEATQCRANRVQILNVCEYVRECHKVRVPVFLDNLGRDVLRKETIDHLVPLPFRVSVGICRLHADSSYPLIPK